jgi:hypothetical protein
MAIVHVGNRAYIGEYSPDGLMRNPFEYYTFTGIDQTGRFQRITVVQPIEARGALCIAITPDTVVPFDSLDPEVVADLTKRMEACREQKPVTTEGPSRIVLPGR